MITLTLGGIIFNWFDINFLSILGYLVIIFIYSLLADCDHKSSKITWWFIGIGIIGMIYAGIMKERNLMIISTIFIALTYVAAEWLPHRGPTHTLWFALLASIPPYFFLGVPGSLLAFIVYLSHLLVDDEFKIW